MKAKLVKHESGFILYDEDNITIGAEPNVLSSDVFSKLSLKNCQAIERGYDLDELAGDEFENSGWTQGFREEMKEDFIEIYTGAFSKALEILITKKFTEEDMRKALHRMATSFMKGYNFDNDVDFQEADKIIQSLQKTEWDVTFNPDELDADGCLILKRV